MRILLVCVLMICTPIVSGCARIELASHIGKKALGSQEQSKGYYKVGSPYKIKGKKYYPKVDYDYDKKGIASWYGPNFHGKKTANGEIYNQGDLTAAHKTLPLPSIVRVTNLENGKSLIVRVNDRGPYAHGRIIDMSKRAAELLGFRNQGVAKVRVQVLEVESKQVANAARQGQDTRGMEIPMNRQGYKSPKLMEVAQSSSKAAINPVVPGHVRDGNFYPDPMISEYPVGSQKIFVQMASFSSRDNAMKYASSLDGYGRAQIHPVSIDRVTYYRVRFPASSIPEADGMLERFIADGYEKSRIVVD